MINLCYLILHTARFVNWASLLRIIQCFKRQSSFSFPWRTNYILYIICEEIFLFKSLAARVLCDHRWMWSVCCLLLYHDKNWKTNTFSVPLAPLADFNGKMFSFQKNIFPYFLWYADHIDLILLQRKFFFVLFLSMPLRRSSDEENFTFFTGKRHLIGRSLLNSDKKPRYHIRKIPFKHRA